MKADVKVEQLRLGRKIKNLAQTKLRKNGNSLVTTIPAKILDLLNWDLGTKLEIEVVLDKNPKGDFLIIRPVEEEIEDV